MKQSGAGANELHKTYLRDVPEAKIQEALYELQRDQAQLLSKVGFDNRLQEGLYAINWTGSFQSLQAALCERIIEGSYGSAHFGRVMRVLRQKGYVDEMEISKLCLLP